MTARPKWCTKENKQHDLFLWWISAKKKMYFKWLQLLYINTPHFLNYMQEHLPKSIPSDTFPLATDSRIAPLPFSHALTGQKKKINHPGTWTRYTLIYHSWRESLTSWYFSRAMLVSAASGVSMKISLFFWIFSRIPWKHMYNNTGNFICVGDATHYICRQSKFQTQAFSQLIVWGF